MFKTPAEIPPLAQVDCFGHLDSGHWNLLFGIWCFFIILSADLQAGEYSTPFTKML
jgi:hypothetical protein